MKFIESIRFENGKLKNLRYHQIRMNSSRKELFGCEDEIDLAGELNRHKTPWPALNENDRKKNLFKLRLIYTESIEQIEISPYSLPKIETLKLVHANQIDYSHKFLDRSQLNKLFQKRAGCDDVLIVKNGLVTDTWFANILFFDGQKWLTPAKPLLKGTQRQFLLDQKKIMTAEIKVEDLKSFEKARLINAMIRFEDAVEISINNILS